MSNKEFKNLAVLSCRRFRGKIHVSEYLDMVTGEIITAEVAKHHGMKAARPDAMLRREQKLNGLRKEVRQFADFLLKFRSQLGGFLVELDQLVKWFGEYEGKEAKHVRRYLPRLVDGEILDFDHRLNRDFMWFDPEAGKSGVRGEAFTAYRIFSVLQLKKQLALPTLPGTAEEHLLAA